MKVRVGIAGFGNIVLGEDIDDFIKRERPSGCSYMNALRKVLFKIGSEDIEIEYHKNTNKIVGITIAGKNKEHFNIIAEDKDFIADISTVKGINSLKKHNDMYIEISGTLKNGYIVFAHKGNYYKFCSSTDIKSSSKDFVYELTLR